MSPDGSTVLGVVLLARHGDREGFYQDPNTYTASNTTITPLGEVSIASAGKMSVVRCRDTSSRSEWLRGH